LKNKPNKKVANKAIGYLRREEQSTAEQKLAADNQPAWSFVVSGSTIIYLFTSKTATFFFSIEPPHR
jgi:hypothetical protein